MSPGRLLIVAGDPSGDMYGSLLIKALRRRVDGLLVGAVGGALMKEELKEDDIFLYDLASLGVTGFVEPAKKALMFLRLRSELGALLREWRPDALVCIDFFGFNRTLLPLAKATGVPSYYFVGPQVWASRAGRVRAIRRFVDHMLVIFPFEEELYRKAGVPVTWVGHPLMDLLPSPEPERTDTAPGTLRLGLLPGSRLSEVRRHLPLFIAASEKILKDFPNTELLLFAASSLPDSAYEPWIAGRRVRIVRESDYIRRASLDIALTSSGTATLENALLGIPMVVVYKLSWPTYCLARAMIRVPHIAMANLLAGKALVPELIQSDATPERVAQSALDMLANPRKLAALRRELLSLRGRLGAPGAIDRAAGILAQALPGRQEPLKA